MSFLHPPCIKALVRGLITIKPYQALIVDLF